MLRRLLQVRQGESTRTILLFTYLFLVIASYVVTKSTRDALFLQRFRADQLPYADLASALTVAAVMSVYLRAQRRVDLQPLLIGTLLAFAAMSLGFWALDRSGEPFWMVPVLYVWAGVAGVLLPAQVWTLANFVVTTREAKRLFGIVSSGALTGWIVGGLITKATAMSLGTESLLLMTAATLAFCPILVALLWRSRKVEPAYAAPPEQEGKGLWSSFEGILRSPHLRAIATLILLSSLVTTLVAWQFRAIAKSHISNTDDLAAFFGTFNVYAGSLSLTTQLFLTSRLLRRFGLSVALLVVPCALLLGSLGVLLSASLWAAVLLKGSDQVLRYSIDRSTVELLYLPVPTRLMAHAKAFIDTVIWRGGDALGAVLVLVVVRMLGATASQLSLVSLALLAAWCAAAIAAKRHYVRNLRESIYHHRVDAERLSRQASERSTSDLLSDALGVEDPADILYALSLVEAHERFPSEAVRHLLDHKSPDVRKKAVALLAATDDTSVMTTVEWMLQVDHDPGVRTEAFLYLTRLSEVDPLARLSELDRVEASSVASAIAQFLARPGAKQNIEAARLLMDTALRGEGSEGHQARLEVARVIGSLPGQFDDQLDRLLNDGEPDVVRLAIRAAATVGKSRSMPLIMARLADPDFSTEATDTLAALGDLTVPMLRLALSSDGTVPPLRHAIPDVLLRVGTPEAEQALVENLLDADPVLRLRTVSALNKLRQQHPNRRLERELVETVLAAEILGHYRSYQLFGRLSVETIVSQPSIDQVTESMDRERERIFRLMKLLLPEQDLHSAYVGLESGNAVVHANAVEFLEQALPPQLKNLLLPLIDSEVGLAERIRRAERIFGTAQETSEQALAVFASSDDLLRDVARHAEAKLGQS